MTLKVIVNLEFEFISRGLAVFLNQWKEFELVRRVSLI